MHFSFFFPKPNGATRTRFECILMHLVPFLDVSGENPVFEEKYFSEIFPDFREIRVSGGPPRALPDLADLDAQIGEVQQPPYHLRQKSARAAHARPFGRTVRIFTLSM